MSNKRNNCYVKFGLRNKKYVELCNKSYVKLVRIVIR